MKRNGWRVLLVSVPVMIVLVGFFLSRAFAGSSVAVTPVADTYVSAAHPNDTHGSLSVLRTDGDPIRIAYIRFSVPGNTTVTKASLQLYATQGNSKGYTAYGVTNDWDAKTVTYNSRPALGAKLGSSGGFGENAWTSVDVTAAVKASGTYSFALTANDSEQTEYSSSEASGNSPRLVVEYGSPAPTPSPTPTPSPSPAPAPTPTPSPGAGAPVHAAFYYPWFPGAWNQQGINPFTQYHPTLGFYSSSDTNVIKQHIASMQYGHLNAGIISWWGQGSREDKVVPLDLQAATNTGFKWSLYYEPEGIGNPSVQQIQSDLNYIKSNYATSPNYLYINNKPVIFVYADGSDGCTMSDRWKQANATQGFYVVLKVFSNYTTCGSQPDNWHQYGPAVATDHQSGHSYSISPGFYKTGESSARLNRDTTQWVQNVKAMVASNEPLQLITTFNEWGEGTSVESAQEWSSASGYGTFLDVLHTYLPAPAMVTPPPVPADSQPPTAPTALSATLVPANRVQLNWGASTDNVSVAGYNVYRNNTVIGSTNGSALSFVDASTAAGATYTYTVKAFDAAGNLSGGSSPVNITTATPPTAPSGLTAQVASATKINLSWSASTGQTAIDHYNIFRNDVLVGTVPSSSLAYSDTTVLPSTAYKYTVSATNVVLLESALSNIVSVTMPSMPDSTPPSVPGSVTATAASSSQINLTWQASTDNIGVAGYTIYRNGSQMAQVGGTTTSFADGTVAASTTYSYTLKAFDAANNTSSASAAAIATTPAATNPTPPPVASGNPCGIIANAPVTYKHVVWIWMENKTYSQVIGNSAAPYTNQLAANCGTASNYQDAGSQYNSLSNYIAATAGVDSCTNGSCPATTWNDCNPSASCQAPIDNLFRQVRTLGGSAKSYEESMPSNCALSGSGTYAPKHNPAAYFTAGTDRQACLTDDMPMGTTTSGALHDALATDASLPTFSFVTPNLCNDTHDCSVQTGDGWLKSWLPLIFSSPAYQSGDTAVFLMYDEDTPAPNVFIAPSVKPGTTSSSAAIGHYAVLRTTEEMLGITTFLGKANAAQSTRSVFNF